MPVRTLLLLVAVLGLLLVLVTGRMFQSRVAVSPARFTCGDSLRVSRGFVPLTGRKGGCFTATPEGLLVARCGGVYEVYLWASCSIGSGGVGSEATILFTLEGNTWYQSLYRPQGGAHYTNFSAVGLVQVNTGQKVALEYQQVDGVAALFLNAVDLRLVKSCAR